MRETLRAYAALMGIGFRAAPWHAALQLLTGVVFAVSTPLGGLGAKLIVNAGISGNLREGLLAAGLIGVVAAASLSAVFYYVHCLFTVQERAGAAASRELMTLIGGAEGLAHYEHPEYLDRVQWIREEQYQLAGMVNATAGVLRVSFTLIVSAILLAQVDLLLLILPVLAIPSIWLGKRSRDLKVAAQDATSEPERLRRHLFELGTSPSSAGELRVYGLTELLGRRHHRVSDDVIHRRDRASWKGAGLQAIDAAVNALGYIGAITLILILVLHKQATAGDVVLVVGVAAQMSATVGTAVMYGTYFLFGLKVGRRFIWLREYATADRRTVADPVPVPALLREGIELRDVRFGYPGADRTRDVLRGISLRLPPGAVVALVGENGAGKTTLVKLLCGFYRPHSGQILVDGADMASFDTGEWRAREAAVFQDFVPLEFTVRETVGVGDLPRINDLTAVGAALERAGASSAVAALPRGLDTRLGTRWEDGVDLSGGQWQKLALGRGLMRTDPLLVVFDEPTSALDADAEHALFERFAQAARTARQRSTITLLVSHRFSTVGMADLIVVLEGGRVSEFGSHQELMTRGGTYAELYELQSRGYR
jgi:ATP-binding cassette subfamily B protein